MAATVEVRLIGSDLGDVMRQMRMWLDHQKVMPDAFRQSSCPGGLALHIEFKLQQHAEGFATRFRGRVLGVAPTLDLPVAAIEGRARQ